jgi:hypothetical protein
MALYRLLERGVLNTATGVEVSGRSHPGWPEYEAWLMAGGVPDPMLPVVLDVAYVDPNSPAEIESAARKQIRNALRVDAAVQALRTRTPAQVDSWIDANVTDLASAREVLKILARVLALLARESL